MDTGFGHKIGLDVRMIQYSGIGTTIRELLNHLQPTQLEKLVLFGLEGWSNPYLCSFEPVPYKVHSIKQHFNFGRSLNRSNLSLFHMPHFDIPLGLSIPLIVTVHDLIHVLYPEYSNKLFTRAYAKFQLWRVVKKASKIIVVSENTKRDLLSHYPSSRGKIEVIYPGIDPFFLSQGKKNQNGNIGKYNLQKGYLLYVGNIRKSKNIEGMLNSYKVLRQKMSSSCPPLVLVGKNSLKKYEKGFPVGVLHLGEVDQADLGSLYSNALAFLFPSFYEGFGLPPLEAMACGTPVVVSDRASLPEVCGEAALYVNPDRPQDTIEAVQQIMASRSLRERLISDGNKNIKRFSWDTFAQKTWNVYEDILGRYQ